MNFGALTLSEVVVSDNRAIGDKTASPGGWPGSAAGGGVYNRDTLTVCDSTFTHNQALGGSADTSGPARNGGRGLGGGVYNDENTPTNVTETNVTASSIAQNLALGAPGNNGGNGGDGQGGAFYNSGIANLIHSIIGFNKAEGGPAVPAATAATARAAASSTPGPRP